MRNFATCTRPGWYNNTPTTPQEKVATLARLASLEASHSSLVGTHEALLESHRQLTTEAERLQLQEVGAAGVGHIVTQPGHSRSHLLMVTLHHSLFSPQDALLKLQETHRTLAHHHAMLQVSMDVEVQVG